MDTFRTQIRYHDLSRVHIGDPADTHAFWPIARVGRCTLNSAALRNACQYRAPISADDRLVNTDGPTIALRKPSGYSELSRNKIKHAGDEGIDRANAANRCLLDPAPHGQTDLIGLDEAVKVFEKVSDVAVACLNLLRRIGCLLGCFNCISRIRFSPKYVQSTDKNRERRRDAYNICWCWRSAIWPSYELRDTSSTRAAHNQHTFYKLGCARNRF